LLQLSFSKGIGSIQMLVERGDAYWQGSMA